MLDELSVESRNGAIIIVEGRKDVAALRKLGIVGEIVPAKSSGKSFIEIVSEVEEIENRNIILLMDFNRRGTEWTKRLVKHLERKRVKVNDRFWRELRNLVGRSVKDVEGLATYMETLKREAEGRHIRT